MVIERALEKLKQAEAETAGRSRAQQPAAAEPSRTARTRSPATKIAERPVLPAVSVDTNAAQENRVLLPYGPLNKGEERAEAAYRMLRTRLLHKMRNSRWTSLAITSAGVGEGKSLTTLNLALSIAREKYSDVVVLDLDMRNPSICRYLGAHPPRELVSYFAGEGTPAETLFSIGVENLAIAGSTAPTEQASELLASSRFEELMDYITSVYANPIVLVDLPPVLVTDEALLVAPRIDAVALVVAEGRTRRDSLSRATQLLSEFPSAGVILNCSKETYGADSDYGSGSRYGRRPYT